MRGSRVIVEGFVDFDYEITLLTVRAADDDGEVQTHFCEPVGHLQVNGDYVESWQPQPMSAAALAAARDIALRITTELGGRGIFGVELFVKGDDVWFSEVSPRPHDTGMVTMATQVQSEFELHARAILGLPVDVRLRDPGASAVIYGGVEARGIRYEDVAHALAVPESDLRLFGKPEAYKRRRMGVALATGSDIDEARAARQGVREPRQAARLIRTAPVDAGPGVRHGGCCDGPRRPGAGDRHGRPRRDRRARRRAGHPSCSTAARSRRSGSPRPFAHADVVELCAAARHRLRVRPRRPRARPRARRGHRHGLDADHDRMHRRDRRHGRRIKPEVAAITAAAMRGEIDFRESLVRRVALLAGLPVEALAARLRRAARACPPAPSGCSRDSRPPARGRCWSPAASRSSRTG